MTIDKDSSNVDQATQAVNAMQGKPTSDREKILAKIGQIKNDLLQDMEAGKNETAWAEYTRNDMGRARIDFLDWVVRQITALPAEPEPKPSPSFPDEATKAAAGQPDREWTVEEREAAEHPRVGDLWNNQRGAEWKITAVSNDEISFERRGLARGIGVMEQGHWVGELHRDYRSYLVSRGPDPKAVTKWCDESGALLFTDPFRFSGLFKAGQDIIHDRRHYTVVSDDGNGHVVIKPVSPEPKAEPLRDGDVPIVDGVPTVISGESSNWNIENMFSINPSWTSAFNILDLADFFRKNPGGSLLMVKKDEVGVAMDRDEATAIKEGYSEVYNAHRRSANAKIRAALAAKEGGK